MIPPVLRQGVRLLAALAAAAAASCASSEPKSVAPAIPTGGDVSSVKALAGRWEGTYTNPQNGRTGTIVLEFFKGNETHGDILMIPPGSKQAKPTPEETLRTMPRVLEINFIDAGAGGQISGAVGPYEDPDTHCQSHSQFSGTVKGDLIQGTFRTECDDKGAPATSGTWSVTRVKRPG
ncbi:MAG TPA: hypothetical protein VKG01_13935 [Thermoanaerobaculia bacterium]|nr:hypothetical protein [Thermoanaerobaculia bacterium]